MSKSGILAGMYVSIALAIGASAVQAQVRKSFDEVEYPEVTFQTQLLGERDTTAKKLDLVNSYLNRPPETLGKAVRSVLSSESEKMLTTLMTRYVDNDKAKAFKTGTGKRGAEISHKPLMFVDKLPSTWFVKDLPGTDADAVGVTLASGVISRMTLYYKHTSKMVDSLVDGARQNNGKKFVYRVFKFRNATFFDALAMVPIYLQAHPELPDEVRRAMQQYSLVDGMTMEQAVAMFGEPDIHYVYEGKTIVSSVEMNGLETIKYTLKGKDAYSWTLVDGKSWTASKKVDGTLYNVKKTTLDDIR